MLKPNGMIEAALRIKRKACLYTPTASLGRKRTIKNGSNTPSPKLVIFANKSQIPCAVSESFAFGDERIMLST